MIALTEVEKLEWFKNKVNSQEWQEEIAKMLFPKNEVKQEEYKQALRSRCGV